MAYRAPLADFQLIMAHVAGFDRIAATDRFAEAGGGTAAAILAEAARLAETRLAPLQRAGDLHPARLETGVVVTPPGFAEGYRAMAAAGFVGMAAAPGHGGLGLPAVLVAAVNEMLAGACLALQLNPLLTQGHIEALEAHADPALRAVYLPPLVAGRWSGTMNLTEPQAGSDVGALRSRATPAGDGSFRITGEKIYITWGDADFAENVCHLVLARLPDAPAGTRGLSLFLVPRHLPDAAGRPGGANALRVLRLEHKLGLHGSPTAVMAYEGATGFLVGAPGGGMAAMFTMMNNARLGVGVQGIGVAEAAFQQAAAHARDRRQGRPPPGGSGAIIDHADVRRMLAAMRAEIFAARAIALACAAAGDMARATGAPGWAARAALLTPIAKAWGSETGIRVADAAIQVQGGAGYVEETGAAQYLRDVRVTAIYEGTNGIQALDLVGRKLADGGEAALALIGEVAARAAAARDAALGRPLAGAAAAMAAATRAMLARGETARAGGAVAYLAAFARLLGADAHVAAAEAAGGPAAALARVYLGRLLPELPGLVAAAAAGAEDLYALADRDLGA